MLKQLSESVNPAHRADQMRAVSSGMALEIIPDVSDCMITSYLVFQNLTRKRLYKYETFPKSGLQGVFFALQVYVWTG